MGNCSSAEPRGEAAFNSPVFVTDEAPAAVSAAPLAAAARAPEPAARASNAVARRSSAGAAAMPMRRAIEACVGKDGNRAPLREYIRTCAPTALDQLRTLRGAALDAAVAELAADFKRSRAEPPLAGAPPVSAPEVGATEHVRISACRSCAPSSPPRPRAARPSGGRRRRPAGGARCSRPRR
jgi:hypothetical protein